MPVAKVPMVSKMMVLLVLLVLLVVMMVMVVEAIVVVAAFQVSMQTMARQMGFALFVYTSVDLAICFVCANHMCTLISNGMRKPGPNKRKCCINL